MSAIDIAVATNSTNTLPGKAKTGDTGSDSNAFEQVYESVGRKSDGSKPAPAKSENKTQNDSADEVIADTPAPTEDFDTGNLSLELAQLISGSANTSAPISAQGDDISKTTSTPLRRDTLPHLAAITLAEEELKADPKSPRLAIIGRETHFAPINTAPNSKFAEQTRTVHSSLDTVTEIGKTSAVTAETDADALLLQKPGSSLPLAENSGNSLPRRDDTRNLQTDTANKSPVAQSAKLQIPTITDDVVSQEMAGGVLTRVADQLITHARDIASASSQPTTAQASAAAQPNEHQQGPVRILRLQLQPEELGMVTARLRIVGGVLELRLTADRQQSVEILQRDQEGLLETLRRAGYKAEIASIDFARPVGNPQATGQPQTNSGSGQSLSQGSAGSSGFNDSTGHSAGEGQEKHQHSTGKSYLEERTAEGQGDDAVRQTRDPQAVYL